MTLYEVQTFYGTYRKTYQKRYNAMNYANKLARQLDLDKDLIEITPYEADTEEYNTTDIED